MQPEDADTQLRPMMIPEMPPETPPGRPEAVVRPMPSRQLVIAETPPESLPRSSEVAMTPMAPPISDHGHILVIDLVDSPLSSTSSHEFVAIIRSRKRRRAVSVDYDGSGEDPFESSANSLFTEHYSELSEKKLLHM